MASEAVWKMKNICVFCASSNPTNEKLSEACVAFCQEMLSRKIGLVYGGGNWGLMGLIGRTISENGGQVLGFIPGALKERESLGSVVYGTQVIVESMHERKFKMYQSSDGFVALPGGFGTLDELLEVITWAQLGIHNKPVGVLNTNGYYDGLLQFVDHAVEQGLISKETRKILLVSDTASGLMTLLESHLPAPTTFNWPVKP